MELLITVLILGILSSLALPQYMRSLERARATEAMTGLKALNDAVYAYAAGREGETACPVSFKKLSVTVPGTLNADGSELSSKDFTYRINTATSAYVPGTDCYGVTAQRRNVAKYDYVIWNPYRVSNTGKGATLACYSPGDITTSREVCQSLDLYTENASPCAGGGSFPCTAGTL